MDFILNFTFLLAAALSVASGIKAMLGLIQKHRIDTIDRQTAASLTIVAAEWANKELSDHRLYDQQRLLLFTELEARAALAGTDYERKKDFAKFIQDLEKPTPVENAPVHLFAGSTPATN